MLAFKTAWRFIIKSPFQTLTVILAVIIGIGVEFFILALGDVLNEMILEQTTSYQDHLQLTNYADETISYQQLDFELRDELLKEKAIKHAFYALTIQGAIIEVEETPMAPIPLDFLAFDNKNADNGYLNYSGLDEKRNISSDSKIPTTDNEIMLDKFFATKNNINLGAKVTYQEKHGDIYSFVVVGFFDLGVFRADNSSSFINMEKFNNLDSSQFVLKVQLNEPMKTEEGLEIVKKYYQKEHYKFITWKEVVPEFNVLNLAQNSTILMIEIFISLAFFVVVLSIFNFSINQKYKQIGILKAMGNNNNHVTLTFFFQTLLITIIGIVLGLIGGTIAIKLYANYMRYPDGEPRFLVHLSWQTYLIPLLLIFSSSLLATFASLFKVRKITIIELIKI